MSNIELEFDEGQAVVHLADGTYLSILTKERQDFVRKELEERGLGGFIKLAQSITRASDGAYEVALGKGEGQPAGKIDVYPWMNYLTDDHLGGGAWVTYGFVPGQLIADYIKSVGVATDE